MLPPPTRLVRTRDGRRYILLRKDTAKYVVTQGEVYSVSGLSAKFGPTKRFLTEHVTIEDTEYTEELLQTLKAQNPEAS